MSSTPYIIAEIGTAHGGDLNKAEKLIKAAARSGADCAKFQVVFADEIIHKKTGTVPLPGGDTPLYQVFRDLEQKEEFYRQLKEMTEAEGIEFLASPFGKKSAEILHRIGSDKYKIASPELNHYPLLKQIASYQGEMILSTGVSTLGDIEEALKITGKNVTLLHCVTAYPAPPEDYNLRLLPLLKQLMGVRVGVSDHSMDPLLIPLVSTAMEASIIEKHFTLSNLTDGLDDPIALEPEAFARMTETVKEQKGKSTEEILSYTESLYDSETIAAALGSGEKKLAPSEEENYERTNRSLHAMFALEKGTVLSEENCALLRTEKILRPGISPRFYDQVLGKKVKCDVPEGEGIRWKDLL